MSKIFPQDISSEYFLKTFPQNPVRAKYDPEHSSLLHVYTIAHFLLAFVATEAVVQGNAGLTQATRFIALDIISKFLLQIDNGSYQNRIHKDVVKLCQSWLQS